ncbi:hypothetical protein SNEBB_002568 [Seison nebaliae]|nr:hypothetical protein SNEBB_002568 [Seison nebaliae]
MNEQNEKLLKRKTGILKRCMKDKISYIKETEEIKTKIVQMVEKNDDEYKIKKMKEILDETKMMIPHSMRTIQKAADDLNKMMMEVKDEVGTSEEFTTAKKLLDEASDLL